MSKQESCRDGDPSRNGEVSTKITSRQQRERPKMGEESKTEGNPTGQNRRQQTARLPESSKRRAPEEEEGVDERKESSAVSSSPEVKRIKLEQNTTTAATAKADEHKALSSSQFLSSQGQNTGHQPMITNAMKSDEIEESTAVPGSTTKTVGPTDTAQPRQPPTLTEPKPEATIAANTTETQNETGVSKAKSTNISEGGFNNSSDADADADADAEKSKPSQGAPKAEGLPEQKSYLPKQPKGSQERVGPSGDSKSSAQSTGIVQDANRTPSITSSSSSNSVEGASAALKQNIVSQTATPNSVVQSAQPVSPVIPGKSTLMSHLRAKYVTELEYMLREFKKLERQLLGAKGNSSGVEETPESRERREKLHSFILHLEDTIRKIEKGCEVEAEGESCSKKTDDEKKESQSAVDGQQLPKEQDEEENVQALEEHILANLLPVKNRLKKQLAAQQGATRNPTGMPAARRGMLQPSVAADKGKGTFALAAEQRRKQLEAAREAAEAERERAEASPSAQSQFGKPLSGNGSSLTQKLHGQTLGSKSRPHGHGVGSTEPAAVEHQEADAAQTGEDHQSKRKVLYAGMAPGSEQILSGVSAAAGVHKMIIETPGLLKQQAKSATATTTTGATGQTTGTSSIPLHPAAPSRLAPPRAGTAPALARPANVKSKQRSRFKSRKLYENDPNLTEEERKRLRKERRTRKKRRDARRREKERQRYQMYQQQQVGQASHLISKGVPMANKKGGKIPIKAAGKKKGPRTVEYICALCSETYASTCEYNPWWALTSHDCPKCRKTQVPRVDISAPANAIEYHPALLAHAEENNSSASPTPPPTAQGTSNMAGRPSTISQGPRQLGGTMVPQKFAPKFPPVSDSESDLSELSDDPLSDGSTGGNDLEDDLPLTPAEKAENEGFGIEYEGPKLTPCHASRLLVMMSHAQTCPGKHKSAKHRDVCNSVKYMMLHVRDCPGTTSTFDVCPFPWCRKVKHLMYHLVACPRPKNCAICSPITLSSNLKALVGLNTHRRKRQKERMKAAIAAAQAAAKVKPAVPKSYTTKSYKPSSFRAAVTQQRPMQSTKTPFKQPASQPTPSSVRVPSIPRVAAAAAAAAAKGKPIAGAGVRPVTKSTNGVVVKSLVKPVGRSSVVVNASGPVPSPITITTSGPRHGTITQSATKNGRVVPRQPGASSTPASAAAPPGAIITNSPVSSTASSYAPVPNPMSTPQVPGPGTIKHSRQPSSLSQVTAKPKPANSTSQITSSAAEQTKSARQATGATTPVATASAQPATKGARSSESLVAPAPGLIGSLEDLGKTSVTDLISFEVSPKGHEEIGLETPSANDSASAPSACDHLPPSINLAPKPESKSPPVFPQVPVVVKQEDSGRDQEKPKEVPPV